MKQSSEESEISPVSEPGQPILARRPAVELVQERIAGLPDNVLEIRMCKCGRAPKRKRQNNCHFCNVEANRKYRKSLKEQIKAFRKMVATVKNVSGC